MPDFQTLWGYQFHIELQIETNFTVNGLGIHEVPPPGWRIQAIDHGGVQFNAQTSEWLFLEPLTAGLTYRISYQIEVPAQEPPGVYRFDGRVLTGSPKSTSVIRGDSEVRVILALPIEMAIAHLNDQGKIDLTLSNIRYRVKSRPTFQTKCPELATS